MSRWGEDETKKLALMREKLAVELNNAPPFPEGILKISW
jgi:hypothetical protein